MKTYHNTNRESGELLSKSRAKARSQQEYVLAFFREHSGEYFTPFEIQKKVLPGAPITSIRRAITNLQKAGFLWKSGYMVLGDWGKNNHCWVFRDQRQRQLGLF